MAGRPPASARSNRSSSSCARARAAPTLHAVEPADHLEVLGPGQVLVDGGVLAGEPDLVAHPVGVGQHVDARHLGAAAVGHQQRGQDPHRRRLAGPVGAEQAEDGALGDGEVEAAQGFDLLVVLHQALGPDHLPRHGSIHSRATDNRRKGFAVRGPGSGPGDLDRGLRAVRRRSPSSPASPRSAAPRACGRRRARRPGRRP